MSAAAKPTNFIRQIIDRDLASGKHDVIVTRFPPEPNGYLHIGHAKSIWLNFGIADDYNGKCTLRFDDTNPAREQAEFVAAIEQDVRWLGYQWQRIAHASDYFEQLHGFACELIDKGLAYVDSLDAEKIRQYRGTLTEPGQDSPYRGRSVAENRDLFAQMRAGEFADGAQVLRAKIDMASPNINLRDPVIYRIRHHDHQRTGNTWCIYPMYDFTHGLSDAIEGVTHSLCTLEFEDHRALYDWLLDNISAPCHPQQIEFSRLNLNYAVMSKRMLTQLVENGSVQGWDDPRMPTICGLRRRGFTPASIRNFIAAVGITKSDNMIEMGVLENSVREDLEPIAPRAMAVLRPLKVIIENYPEGEHEQIQAPNHPRDASMGTRTIALGREIYIEQDDFMERPPDKFFRLAPDREVRLRYGFVIRCTEVIKNPAGEVMELRCQYDPDTRRGRAPGGRKVKGIIHWVSASHCVEAEVRLYDRLFSEANPRADKSRDFKQALNPDSLHILPQCKLEASLASPKADTRYQFERLGYFYADQDSNSGNLIYNRIVTLRDAWARIAR
ncbi:glutamine--tRNA ligase/YqeY domain fusion protein [Candidatus Spongiihabitans sp.]|uniref:glutamine--tRNA ligase/YqeY domain fusion protein n=1 Tax=Candidatus Spongiihabitans sp. TaxID=3101308 RepID=UPI003C7ADE95